jgi:disulfide bond formation protein DsbB
VLVASVAILGTALLSQYVGGLTPCELCLLERWPYYIAAALSLAALLIGRPGVTVGVTALCGLVFLVSAGLAAYHVGVEQHWIAGPSACTGGGGGAHSIADLKAQLLAMQPVRCDEVQWSLFGVSMAGWNLVASLLLAGFCLQSLRRPAWRARAA